MAKLFFANFTSEDDQIYLLQNPLKLNPKYTENLTF